MPANLAAAIQDFRRARRRAGFEELAARLAGRSTELLSYEDVRRKLRALETPGQELRDIPLDAIVGTVDRYDEFTRSFHPRRDDDEQRWARVMAATTDTAGLPPIEVYQIGQAYFVRDGHHRVSVARQLGATRIEAYVTEVRTKVPLTPDVQPDELIVKAEWAAFLERTRIDELRPQADLTVTAAGQAPILEEHIQVHRYFMGLERQQAIPYEEAVTHWYDQVYLPVAEVVQERGMLHDFPGRTEADLYLLLSAHRAALEEALGWRIEPAAAAADLVEQIGPKAPQGILRLGERVLEAVLPRPLQPGPPSGQWRRDRLDGREEDRLFAEILLALDGQESGWQALEEGIALARAESGRLYGLHVVPTEEEREAEAVAAIRARFEQRCREAGVEGQLAVESGSTAPTIVERARWADLVVVSLTHPPPPQVLEKLSSGLHSLLRRSPRPVLAVPAAQLPLQRLLLAYDGSPGAAEALFVSAYLAGRLDLALSVISVAEGKGFEPQEVLARADSYLQDRGLEPALLTGSGATAEAIVEAAEAAGSDLIVIGGHGYGPLLDVVRDSTVDQLLRLSRRPVLVCQ